MVNLTLVTTPRYSPTPHYGLHFLSKNLDPSKVKVTFFDANLDLYKNYSSGALWGEIEKWGIQQHYHGNSNTDVWNIVTQSCQAWAEKIVATNCDYIGVNVFTHESRNWAQTLCYYIRRTNPNIKIILGGRGINDPGGPIATFAQNCLDWQLCDFYINGEAETSLGRLLDGDTSVANNKETFIEVDTLDLKHFSRPNLADYTIVSNWYNNQDTSDNDHHVSNFSLNDDKYKMFSTRGCVKRCTFCDIHLMRKKFSMRTAQNVFDEIKYAIEEHGVKRVSFTDDMINGSNKQFTGWMDLLANYLSKNSITDFTWTAQFGIKREIPNHMYDLLNATGSRLTIGVDHFSTKVLEHMQKKYSESDIYEFFEKGREHNLIYGLLMFIVCYPTETLEDFEILKRGVKYLSTLGDQIETCDFGTTCIVPRKSILFDMPGMRIGKNLIDWTYTGNPNLTLDEKLRRRREIDQYVESVGLKGRIPRTQWLRIESWLTPST